MTYVSFRTESLKNKPNTLHRNDLCPFCDREGLRKEGNIIKETEEFLILKNKYPVVGNADSVVIVEHNSCDEHIETYSVDYLTRLLTFSLNYYKELENSGEYKSIAFFKNHGIQASGSLKHPHMQMLAFKDVSYHENIKKEHFEGITIKSNSSIEWNISTNPISEQYEINLLLKEKQKLGELAFYLQKSVRFVLEELNKRHQCYNLAFYIEKENIKVKVISRFPNSILLLGYGIHYVPNNLEEIAQKLRAY